MFRKNLVLCGFMGCGKTTVGEELAWRILYDFVDLDERIAEQAGQSVPDLFAARGEAGFRELEREVFAELCREGGQVIASGGGTLLDPESARVAKETGRVVFINTSFDLCYDRIKNSERPLVRANTREQLEALYLARLPQYQAACDFEIFNQHSPRDAAKAIFSSIL